MLSWLHPYFHHMVEHETIYEFRVHRRRSATSHLSRGDDVGAVAVEASDSSLTLSFSSSHRARSVIFGIEA
jgi:hypothetical protein